MDDREFAARMRKRRGEVEPDEPDYLKLLSRAEIITGVDLDHVAAQVGTHRKQGSPHGVSGGWEPESDAELRQRIRKLVLGPTW